MIFDALVLAGGRSSRLAGEPKALLSFEGRTLLERALDAAQDARRSVIVGDPVSLAGVLGGRAVLFAREEPPFAGPASAIAAGFAALGRADAEADSDHVLVLACDMPLVGAAVAALLAAAAGHAGVSATRTVGGASGTGDDERPDAFVARSPDGRLQPLAAVYRTAALDRVIQAQRSAGSLSDLSVRALLGSLATVPVDVPEGTTDDIDTPADAGRFGIGLP